MTIDCSKTITCASKSGFEDAYTGTGSRWSCISFSFPFLTSKPKWKLPWVGEQMKPSIELHKPTFKAAPSFSGRPRRSPGLLYSRERQVSVGYATGPDGSTGLREKEGLSPTSDTHI